MMDIATLKLNLTKIVAQRNIFLCFSLLLAATTAVLSCLLLMKRERTIILPTVGPSLWVEESNVSDTYLSSLGSYLADLLLTRTPSDVDSKNARFLEHVHPTFYHEARRQLLQEKETLTAGKQTLLFRPFRSFVDGSKTAYVTEGELLALVGKIGETPSCAEAKQKRFTFEFHCERGKLLLTSLKQENL